MFKLLFLLLFISANNCFAKEVKFHKPETEAEKVVDIIIRAKLNMPIDINKIKSINQELYNNIINNNHKKNNYIYDKILDFFMTEKLKKSIKNYTEEDCRYKKYQEDTCGENYNIVCGSDSDSNGYLYYTQFENKNTAYIDNVWSTNYKTKPPTIRDYIVFEKYINRVPKYKMKKENGYWKLDGLRCYDNDMYNFNYHSSNLATSDSDK